MRDPEQPFFSRFMPVPGMLIGMAVTQAALADSDEPAAPLTGPRVYNAVCIDCHVPPGVGGCAPGPRPLFS